MPKVKPNPNIASVTLTKVDSRVLRLNVGFLLKEGVGYSREFVFDEPLVHVADDLTVHNLGGSVTLTRTPQGLYAQGRLTATIDNECARCLDPYEQLVSVRLAELYHYPPESAPPDSPAISDDVHLDLTPVVREDFLLSVPMHALCRPDCKGLCSVCGASLNDADPAEHEHGAEPDPRWAKLRELKLDQ